MALLYLCGSLTRFSKAHGSELAPCDVVLGRRSPKGPFTLLGATVLAEGRMELKTFVAQSIKVCVPLSWRLELVEGFLSSLGGGPLVKSWILLCRLSLQYQVHLQRGFVSMVLLRRVGRAPTFRALGEHQILTMWHAHVDTGSGSEKPWLRKVLGSVCLASHRHPRQRQMLM